VKREQRYPRIPARTDAAEIYVPSRCYRRRSIFRVQRVIYLRRMRRLGLQLMIAEVFRLLLKVRMECDVWSQEDGEDDEKIRRRG
jgi:hypothetical protein